MKTLEDKALDASNISHQRKASLERRAYRGSRDESLVPANNCDLRSEHILVLCSATGYDLACLYS